MNYLDQLEKILDQGYRLVSMETYDVSRVIDLFTELSRFTNKAYYCWNAGVGVTYPVYLSQSSKNERTWRSLVGTTATFIRTEVICYRTGEHLQQLCPCSLMKSA